MKFPHPTSSKNRNGKITNLTSNKDLFSFGVRIEDENVETDEKIGDFRTFNLTDYAGEWYDGWSSIQFSPTAKENSFLNENSLWRRIFRNVILI